MRKRRFLCFDLTPRWKMWKRIEDLEVRLATCLCERNEADGRLIEREHEVLALTQARDTLYKRIDELEGRLRKMGYSICSNKQRAVTEDGRPTQFNEYYMPQVADSCQ